MQRYGDDAAFVSAGGYHHHIGLNSWESKGGSPPPPGTTGLFHTAIRYPTRRALADALQRLVEAGVPLDRRLRPRRQRGALPRTTPTATGSSSTGTGRRRTGRSRSPARRSRCSSSERPDCKDAESNGTLHSSVAGGSASTRGEGSNVGTTPIYSIRRLDVVTRTPVTGVGVHQGRDITGTMLVAESRLLRNSSDNCWATNAGIRLAERVVVARPHSSPSTACAPYAANNQIASWRRRRTANGLMRPATCVGRFPESCVPCKSPAARRGDVTGPGSRTVPIMLFGSVEMSTTLPRPPSFRVCPAEVHPTYSPKHKALACPTVGSGLRPLERRRAERRKGKTDRGVADGLKPAPAGRRCQARSILAEG